MLVSYLVMCSLSAVITFDLPVDKDVWQIQNTKTNEAAIHGFKALIDLMAV